MPHRPWNVEITANNLLIVEGPDDKRFFEALLNHSRISGFQVVHVDGVDNLRGRVRALKSQDEFKRVDSFGIVCDADDSREATFRRICGVLGAASLPVPPAPQKIVGDRPRVSALVIPPDEAKAGRMLEDLCLESVADDPAMSCVDEYFKCLEIQEIAPKQVALPKARLHTFLASRERPGLRLGEAAEKNDIPLDSPVFEPVVNFLRQLSAG